MLGIATSRARKDVSGLATNQGVVYMLYKLILCKTIMYQIQMSASIKKWLLKKRKISPKRSSNEEMWWQICKFNYIACTANTKFSRILKCSNLVKRLNKFSRQLPRNFSLAWILSIASKFGSPSYAREGLTWPVQMQAPPLKDPDTGCMQPLDLRAWHP